MASTTSGELGLTKYSAGEKPWDHSGALDTIDSIVSDLMHGKFRDLVNITAFSTNDVDLTSGQKGASVLTLNLAGADSLTTISNGTSEQFLFLFFQNQTNAATINHGTGADQIDLSDNANWTPSTGDWLCLWYDGTTWREVFRWGVDFIKAGHIAAGVVGSSELASGAVTTAKIAAGSVTEAKMAASSVNSGALKKGTSSGSVGAGGTVNLGNQEYFAPRVDSNSSGAGDVPFYCLSTSSTTVAIRNTLGVTLDYIVDYVSGSPPHFLGGKEWGMFIWLLRDATTKDVLEYHVAQDPPWDGNKAFVKNSPEQIEECPHPWNHRDLTGLEVVLVDNSEHDNEEVELSVGEVMSQKYLDKKWSNDLPPQAARGVLERADRIKADNPRKLSGKRRQVLNDRAIMFREKIADLVLTDAIKAADTDTGIKFGTPIFDDVVRIVKP